MSTPILPQVRSIRVTLIFVLFLSSLLTACDREPGPTAPEVIGHPDKNDPVPNDPEPYPQETLTMLWEGSSHSRWDVVSAKIDPITGGRVSGVPESWPAEYEFGMFVPPGALAGTDSVEISILVPQRGSDSGRLPVFHFEPDGIVFSKPVVVRLFYPYWLTEDEIGYEKFCIKWEERNGERWYYITDYEALRPEIRDGPDSILFETNHFSRWAMQNGSGGDEELTWDGPQRDPLINRYPLQ